MRLAVILLALPPLLAAYAAGVVLTFDTSQTLPQYLLLIPLAYMLGSVPWGFLLIRLTQGEDIRESGSGGIGTSNVLRRGGTKVAAAVLVLDMSKGVLAVLLAVAIADTAAAEVTAGLMALVGHNWPVFLKFKGGRGIATGAGALGLISPIALAASVSVFAITVYATRYVSLGSLLCVIAAVVVTALQAAIWGHPSITLIYTGVGGAMIFWQHRGNIHRLLNGSERRLGEPNGKAPERA